MKKLGLALASLALAAASFASCALATGTPNAATSLSASDLKSLQSSYMLSYYADSSGSPEGVSSIRALTPFSASASSGVAARTTVPVGTYYASLDFSSLTAGITIPYDYPEAGQTTSFKATEADSANGVYKIEVTTTYPAGDARESYYEVYYVQSADGTWTDADPIVSGSASTSWTPNPIARDQMTLTYRDGSVRNETIHTSSVNLATDKYAFSAFPLTGPMDLAQISEPTIDASDPDVMFSSVVYYVFKPSQECNSFWFWKGKKNAGIVGIRYYTEYADVVANKYIARSASYEKIVGSIDSVTKTYDGIRTCLYSAWSNTLGGSVVRQEITSNLAGSSTSGSDYYHATGTPSTHTKMQTRISDYMNSWDYVLTQDNVDKVTLSSTVPW